jgi:hypothetical protein
MPSPLPPAVPCVSGDTSSPRTSTFPVPALLGDHLLCARRADTERLREHDGQVHLRLADLLGRNADRVAGRSWLVLALISTLDAALYAAAGVCCTTCVSSWAIR